jgi:signal transduction histidine kinase/CheY-like chemotaxis protein
MRWPAFIPRPLDARTQLAMVRQFFDLSRLSLVSASLLIVLHLGYVWGRLPHAPVLLWAGLFFGQLLLRALWRRQVLALDDADLAAQLQRWERRAALTSLSTALLWALALAMAFASERASGAMYAAMLSCFTVVASISVMAPLPLAFLALALPIGLALAALLLTLPGAAAWYFAAISLLASAMAWFIMVRHARLLFESHALRYEREELLSQTRQARDAQVRFLAAASHDLRQPVHALGLLAAQVGEQLQGRRAGDTAHQLQQMVGALDGLVEALLDVSRLDSGAVPIHPAPLRLQRLFDRLAPEFAVLADARGLQWRLRPTELWVRSDAAQLERMLRNLLSNALRYTLSGGVLLAARERGGQVEIGVWDTGVGIPPEQQSRVFEEFVQLQNPGRDRSRGHGLGLAIVARLSKLLQHPVKLHSRVGRGSCFVITLPLAEPQAETAPKALPAQPVSPLAGLRVGLVEDDAAVLKATEELLQTWGCRVWGAASGEALAERLQPEGTRIDRLISDWRLVEGDGLQAIALLRHQQGEALPAMLLSGEPLPRDDEELRALRITPAQKPLPALALRAWLSAPT